MREKIAANSVTKVTDSAKAIFENSIWMTIQQTAKYLSRTENAIRILISRKVFKVYQFDRTPYIKRTEIDDLLESSALRGGF